MPKGTSVGTMEQQRLRSLKRLAEWADRLGVRLELNIRLPQD